MELLRTDPAWQWVGTYSAPDFGEKGEETLGNAAPESAALDKPQRWVSLAERIAGYCDVLIE